MIYTIGDEYSYIRAYLNSMGGSIYKSPPDGVAFKTENDAKKFIDLYGRNLVMNPVVFYLNGDWDKDTVISREYNEEWIRHVRKKISIIFPPKTAKKVHSIITKINAMLESGNYSSLQISKKFDLYEEAIEFIKQNKN